MADVHFECPKCAQPINAPGELSGQLTECPTCNQIIEVPFTPKQPDATPPPVPRAVPITPPTVSRRYSVVPFVAVIDKEKGSAEAAAQLQQLIQSYASQGWEYVRLESVETYIAGDNGCFGIGATPPRTTVYSMAVFRL